MTGLPEPRPRPFPWADAMALGLGRLRLLPDQFWSLTPKELILMAGGGTRRDEALEREALTRLMQRYPDEGG